MESALISEWTKLPYSAQIAFIFLIGGPIVVKLAGSNFDFYEIYVRRRYLNRIAELAEKISQGDLQLQFIDLLRDNEIFRLVSGLRTSPVKANALMLLYTSGCYSIKDLRLLAYYVDGYSDHTLSVEVKLRDKWFAGYSLASAIFIFVIGVIWAFGILLAPTSLLSILLAVSGLSLCVVVAGYLLKDFKAFRMATRLKKALAEANYVTKDGKPCSLVLGNAN
ncbi:hypothetical protein [Allohahella sp. A8]|uniref:hypothetical protein n=1 Tax=Allohahella sp. A8 TaxID=3141461 RepID=UPI003A8080E0